MGCVFTSHYSLLYWILPKELNPLLYKPASNVQKSDEPKVYSWDARKNADPSNYMIENRNGETICKLPGTLNGTQFIIQNLQDCTVYLLDHIAQLSVDDCKNCKFIIGPSKGSVFIRDCSDCNFAIICQQFRTRDCKRITSFLSCTTQPIIESSTLMKFGCISISYSQLNEQLNKAGLSPFNNNWNNIHDFTPIPGEPNFSLLNKDYSIEDYIAIADESMRAQTSLTFDKSMSAIPYTLGVSYRPMNQSVLIVILADDSTVQALAKQEADALDILERIMNSHPDLVLVQTKKYNLSELSAENVFRSKNYSSLLQKAPIIGLELNGNESVAKCQRIAEALQNNLIYVTPDAPTLNHQIDSFYNFADMSMSV